MAVKVQVANWGSDGSIHVTPSILYGALYCNGLILYGINQMERQAHLRAHAEFLPCGSMEECSPLVGWNAWSRRLLVVRDTLMLVLLDSNNDLRDCCLTGMHR
ncbi:uncharacterized protein MCYG_05166 [Microsporum canis CBS 113480]|uniref:Uncharacterized protein n=1 Tax=Arthroderma otae (strain ATCC MYA-4605 / CBS 113480) TaxID=554155 RepID=C5FR44_ARTOC|nr:uncharacterized protein MCYG_05166 [Microsporum canis CBS 113480]EEQ32347.1 predicted protein [Microsporum canis CBS 113480]